MIKTKKIKGGFTLFITEDEKLLTTTSSRNTVYVYNLETKKLELQVKTISNVSDAVISPDKKLLAVKNTSGAIAIISMETGEELGKTIMEQCEGEPMTFAPDNKHVLDFDWDGRTMLLDTTTMSHYIMDGPASREKRKLPRTDYIQYDRYSKQIYKFMADEYGNSKGRIFTSSADTERISFEVVREFGDVLPDHLKGISFCSKYNYYIDIKNDEVVVTDKKFAEVSRIAYPLELKEKRTERFWISANEKYMFVSLGKQCDLRDFSAYENAKSLSYLFELSTMKVIEEFDYDYVSDFVMYDDDRKFVIATWKGSYLGEIKNVE